MRTHLLVWLLAACLFPIPGTAAPWHFTKTQMTDSRTGWALASTPRGSVLLRTTNGGASWKNVSPRVIWPLSPAQIAASENDIASEGIDFDSLSGQTCWAAMISGDTRIIVEQTHDGGRHWTKSQFGNQSGYSLLLSFLDRRHGWLLTISDMASGSTRKDLFRTTDGGKTWAFVTRAIPDHIDPNGLTFRTASIGWLAAGYHGYDEMPLYRTNDGGRHWRLQVLPEPAGIGDGYGIISRPRFFGPQRRDGSLVVNYRGGTRFERILYSTHDGGQTWRIGRHIRTKNAGRD